MTTETFKTLVLAGRWEELQEKIKKSKRIPHVLYDTSCGRNRHVLSILVDHVDPAPDEVIELFMSRGMTINDRRYTIGFSPIGNVKTIHGLKRLLQLGANPNIYQNFLTPVWENDYHLLAGWIYHLRNEVREVRFEIIKILMSYGANPYLPYKKSGRKDNCLQHFYRYKRIGHYMRTCRVMILLCHERGVSFPMGKDLLRVLHSYLV